MSAAKMFMSIFGFSGIHYESFQEENDTIIFNASTTKKKEPCPHCGSFNNHFKGTKTRIFRMIPLNRHKCYLKLILHRIYCLDCRRCTWPSLNFVTGKERMVKAFVQHVLDLLQLGTILSESQILGVGWDLVKNIHKSHLKKKYRKIPFSSLRYLSVDEFSIRKGHTYMTIFVDIETGRIIFATEGRRREDIIPFLRKLAKKAPHLQAIAMDMSLPY